MKVIQLTLGLCGGPQCVFLPDFLMDLYNDSQVPTPSAIAWTVDRSRVGGPTFVILRTRSSAARADVVDHLVEVGFGPDPEAIESLVAWARVSETTVVW